MSISRERSGRAIAIIPENPKPHTKKQKTMKPKHCLSLAVPALVLLMQFCGSGTAPAQETDYAYFKKWRAVVNNNDLIPGSAKNYNSYNQPSINSQGLVVFRARSKGPDTESGIWTRDMVTDSGEIKKIADRKTFVPAPNNTLYAPDNTLAAFNEFPSIPRIAMYSQTIATRGNSQPTWTYLLPDMTETKVGTTGIFVNPCGTLMTGASLLGAVPDPGSGVVGTDYFPYFQVPGAVAGTRFDVFPGSPSVTDENIIAFKGNYTEATIGKTGVFFRDLLASGGVDPVKLIANTGTIIPNLPAPVTGITFGSTAPPSAAGGRMVFAGYDNEETPTYGGIYLAPLSPSPALTTIAGVGSPVPNVPGETFKQFGEALSFDGRYVAFWGTWGTETKRLVLDCPADGNADLIAYCMSQYPNGYAVDIPVHQGMFVHDTTTGVTTMVTQTGSGIDDFLYWTYSGKPPGVGGGDEGDGELPRWRSSAFVAVSGTHISGAETAFKARTGAIVANHYDNPVDAIYWSYATDLTKLVDTTTGGQSIDPEAPAGSVVSALSIERESFRGGWLAISVSMLEPVSGESMAGIYVSGVGPGQPPVVGNAWRWTQLTTIPNAAYGLRTGASHPAEWCYFYKGIDRNMWATYWNGTQWAPSQLTSDANVDDWLVFGTSYNMLCYKGLDNTLRMLYYNGSIWVPALLGGTANVAGDVVVDDDWNLIYYRGNDSRMWITWWTGTQWMQTSLGGTPNVEGSLAVDPQHHLIYYRSSGQMWCYYWTGAGWAQAQLSASANVGGSVAADTAGGVVYYRSSTDSSAWCVYWNGSAWANAQLDAAAGMSSADSIAPLAPNVVLYLTKRSQCGAEFWNGSAWVNTLLGDGGSCLTGGLSVQRIMNWAFVRRSDGHVVVFYQ
jgi:hypothetical protein